MSGKARLSINGVFVCEVTNVKFGPEPTPNPAIEVIEAYTCEGTIRDEDLERWLALFSDAPVALPN